MEQLVDIGEQLIFILMGLASVLALAVGFERSIIFSKFAKGGENTIKAIIERLRKKDIKGIEESSQNPTNVYSRFAGFSAEHYPDGQEALVEMMAGKVIDGIKFQERIASPNGEDHYFIFYQESVGNYLILMYNVFNHQISTPIICNGATLFENGELVYFKTIRLISID